MCRLSIIVPYNRDEAAFETTLVSVLENRPEYCEILVAHDGGYNDPFDLGDEVRFVVSEDGGPVGLIRAGVQAAMGRIVHILGSGARATEAWTDEPTSMFEQSELGSVAPVVCDVAEPTRILAAGWTDSKSSLRSPVGAGAKELGMPQLRRVQGIYLDASFWRRSVLEALLDLPTVGDLTQTEYLWSTAARGMGWRCRVSPDSIVYNSKKMFAHRGSAFECGKVLQQVRMAGSRDSAGSTLLACLGSVLGSPLTGVSIAETLGRVSALVGGSAVSRKLATKIREVAERCNPKASEPRVLSMPGSANHIGSTRRAA